jgi:hypothetical protein
MASERAYTKTIHHSGRIFFATVTMTDIFVAHARDIAARGDTELVPLLHRGGVDLLLVGPDTVYAVADIEIGLDVDAHEAREVATATDVRPATRAAATVHRLRARPERAAG